MRYNPWIAPDHFAKLKKPIDTRTQLPGKFAVLTTHFNPTGSTLLRENYTRFAEGMHKQDLDLWTIEITFGKQDFFLPSNERTLQINTQDVLWQRDRALNVLIEMIPNEYDKVALVDADLLFNNKNWDTETNQLLEEVPIVQCFSTTSETGDDGSKRYCKRISLAKVMENKEKDLHSFAYTLTGCAWAIRRDLLDKNKLYDACVTGANDVLMAIAFFGFDNHTSTSWLNEPMTKHFLEWADGMFLNVQGNVRCTEGRITHLWHGPKNDRHGVGRIECLTDNHFDPNKDIKIGDDGLWHWATNKTRMHNLVRNYFSGRTKAHN